MKGIYLLIISVHRDIQINIGALGKTTFERGIYVYVGSAQNSLEKRVKRHISNNKVKFWHIDYLLENEDVTVVEVFWKKAGKSEECEVARKLKEKGIPITNFGCSDCTCVSHLFMLGGFDSLESWEHYFVDKISMRSMQ